jgi:class 3 adenylate cyclase
MKDEEEEEEEPATPTPTQQQTKYPFNGKIWTFIRSLLANAKPVGFEELQDPTVAVHKGPKDAHNFLSKVISIKPLNPIHPAFIAQMGDFEEHEVLAELFYGVMVGLVAMRFAPECIQCGSEVMDTDMLGRLPCTARCTGCYASNVIDSMDKIKVMFLLNSNVLYILAENFACTPSAESLSVTNVFAAIPANSTGSGYSYCIGTGSETEIAPALPPGKYRMHCPVALTDNYLIVKGDAVDGDPPVKLKLNISDLVYRHKKGKTKAELHVPHGKIQFDLFPDTNSLFVLWIQQDVGDKILMHLPSEERSAYTSATKVIHHPIFNALFHQVSVVSVRDSIFLSISHVVLVFTDIVDSTKMYTFLGDGDAFKLVRKHFQVLFGSFTRNGGRVVKTIGDAVMASFISPSAALMAVSEAMALLPMIGRRPDTNNFVEIRVGIHSGQATVVPLNGVNDYFGQTTNIAARVQSCAKGSECFITETTLLSCGAEGMETYNELTRGSIFKATPLVELTLKGVNDKVHARGFRWSMHSHRQSELRKSIGSYYRERRAYSRLFSSFVSIAESGGSNTKEGDYENVE